MATGAPVRNPQEHAQPRQLQQHLAHSIAVPLRRGNGFLFREFVIWQPHKAADWQGRIEIEGERTGMIPTCILL